MAETETANLAAALSLQGTERGARAIFATRWPQEDWEFAPLEVILARRAESNAAVRAALGHGGSA